ncbi:MAG: peptidase C39 [Lachnospiraceae bacterium]|nr:peptidase C39 [Lachnospiraceae bacterium]
MKNPLHYQLSEYDCGPTSMLNAMAYLFEREQLSPELLRNIMLYCLDCYGKDGITGKSGTSCMAMMFLSNWLNGFGTAGHLPVSSRFLSGEEVNFNQNGLLRDALCRGGAAVVRVDFEGWHYVLLTGIRKEEVLVFDPYYRKEDFPWKEVQMIPDQPTSYNRIIPTHFFDQEEIKPYSFGPEKTREAVLIFNEETKLTAEKTIEYMI